MPARDAWMLQDAKLQFFTVFNEFSFVSITSFRLHDLLVRTKVLDIRMQD